MKTTLKEVVTSENWIIDKVLQGYGHKVRVDAHTRHHIPDGNNRFSEWGSKKYIDRVRREAGRRPLEITQY